MQKYISQKGVYMCDFYGAKGCEEKGFRPAIIVQNNVGNTFSPTTWVVPITSQNKKDILTHHTIKQDKYDFLTYESCIILCEQLTVRDICRLGRYIGKIDDGDFNIVIEKIKNNLKVY